MVFTEQQRDKFVALGSKNAPAALLIPLFLLHPATQNLSGDKVLLAKYMQIRL
jgi:hypothetical protein